MFAPRRYCIRVKGRLGPEWSEWLDELAISPETDGETTLTGLLVDQAALHGLLARLRDLGLVLVSLTSAPDEGLEKLETAE